MALLEDLWPRRLNEYLDQHVLRGPPPLQEIEAEGRANRVPIVGSLEGSFLYLLAKSVGARRVLELGAAIGYSTSWLALAVGEGGRVTTVEHSAVMAKQARANLTRVGVSDRVEILQDEALAAVKRLTGPFDLVFNDIDKEGYPAILPECMRLLRVGGLLVTDNVLWGGEVATKAKDPDTVAIRRYNEMLFSTPGLESVLLPVRDGVAVSLRVA